MSRTKKNKVCALIVAPEDVAEGGGVAVVVSCFSASFSCVNGCGVFEASVAPSLEDRREWSASDVIVWSGSGRWRVVR